MPLLVLALAFTAANVALAPIHRRASASLVPADAWPVIRQSLAAGQTAYHVAPKPDGFQAANPDHEWNTRFDTGGPTLTAADDAWTLSLELQAYGYGRTLHPVQPATLEADGPRVDYRRGDLTEWYLNGPFGLEQGFTLNQPPAEGRGLLTLELGLSSNWRAMLDADGLGLTLRHAATGTSLRYAGLAAWDAAGQPLPTSLRVRGHTLRLRVDDHGATYPLTVDPTVFTELQKLTASDAQDVDFFGEDVDISATGDTIVVGATFQNRTTAPTCDGDRIGSCGAAYVFELSAGVWSQSAKLTASDAWRGDRFGNSVAINAAGDTIVAGARLEDGDATPTADCDGDNDDDCGAVYVFEKQLGADSGAWEDGAADQSAKLTASDAQNDDAFGYSVAIDAGGDTIAVGAVQESGTATPTADCDGVGGVGEGNDACGAVYVFEKANGSNAGAWEDGPADQSAKLTASDAQDDDRLGEDVAINAAGDTIVASAPDDLTALTNADCDSGGNCGAAYVFEKQLGSDAAAWEDGADDESAKLIASDREDNDVFGADVAVGGGSVTIVIGASYEDDAPASSCTTGNTDCGAAYVYVHEPSVVDDADDDDPDDPPPGPAPTLVPTLGPSQLPDLGHAPVPHKGADADREPGSLLWAIVAPLSMLIAAGVVTLLLRRTRDE